MPPTDKTAEALDAIREELSSLNEALLGSARPGSAPGLIQRMNASEADRADLRRIVGELMLSVRTLEATPGRAALSWLERLALGVLSLALGGLGVLIGRITSGGTHP